ALSADDEIAEVRTGWDLHGQAFGAFLDFLGGELFVGTEAGLALGDAGARGHAGPFQLALQGLLAGVLLSFFLVEATFLLFEPGGVVALERVPLAAVELQNPLGDIVEEV